MICSVFVHQVTWARSYVFTGWLTQIACMSWVPEGSLASLAAGRPVGEVVHSSLAALCPALPARSISSLAHSGWLSFGLEIL